MAYKKTIKTDQSIVIQTQREILKSMLTTLGYTVQTVSSGEEAILYMQGNTASLLLLNMFMAPASMTV